MPQDKASMSKLSKNLPNYSIVEVDWRDAAEIARIRTQVFITEQSVTPELEWDGLDETALHLLALDHDNFDKGDHVKTPVGCARIIANGVIGRMAVLKDYRGRGIGRTLLRYAIECCHLRGWHEIKLSAQIHALEFYQREGFTICSEEYLDAGILHRDMKLSLNT